VETASWNKGTYTTLGKIMVPGRGEDKKQSKYFLALWKSGSGGVGGRGNLTRLKVTSCIHVKGGGIKVQKVFRKKWMVRDGSLVKNGKGPEIGTHNDPRKGAPGSQESSEKPHHPRGYVGKWFGGWTTRRW